MFRAGLSPSFNINMVFIVSLEQPLQTATTVFSCDDAMKGLTGAMKTLGKWRAVALDLDGTTLNSSLTLTPRTLEAIRQVDAWWRNRGNRVADLSEVNFEFLICFIDPEMMSFQKL